VRAASAVSGLESKAARHLHDPMQVTLKHFLMAERKWVYKLQIRHACSAIGGNLRGRCSGNAERNITVAELHAAIRPRRCGVG
jgi:hypothetical protein